MDEAASGSGLVHLTEVDVPGASLAEPLEKQSAPALKQWLLCRGIETSSNARKKQLLEQLVDIGYSLQKLCKLFWKCVACPLYSIKVVKADGLPVIDVDGGSLARKWHRLLQKGLALELLPIPQPLLMGWEELNADTLSEVATKIPKVSHGTIYQYLSEGVGHDGDSKTFRALYSGNNHWASGRVEKIEVNTQNLYYCFVRSIVTLSMKTGNYKVNLLLSGGPCGYGQIVTASCKCAAGLSSSCVHVSAILHALVALNPSSQPNPSTVVDGDAEQSVPVTSLINSWKPPRKRKESTVLMSEAKFQKHTYGSKPKHQIAPIESFDPRPERYRGTAHSGLEHFLQSTKGMGLCVSLLFDDSTRVWRPSTFDNSKPPTAVEYNVLSKEEIQVEVKSFKESLAVSEAEICCIEKETREQRDSLKWFQYRRFRITASHFGDIRRRRNTTHPQALVLHIIEANPQEKKGSVSMVWGRSNESLALENYKQEKVALGCEHIVVTQLGLWVSPDYPFLGATPDAAIYDPSKTQAFGFAEVKCPYKHKEILPKESCADPSFCCQLVEHDGSEQLQLKVNHPYYSQIQRQMAIGCRSWNDFIMYTTKGITVERIYFDKLFLESELLPKRVSFYDNCIAPEILHPMHAVGLPVRDLCKE